MAQIRCGNCGGTHDSVAEVRRCSVASPAVAPAVPPATVPPVAVPSREVIRRSPVAWAGPDHLGRGLVVEPGAEVAEPWRDAPRLRVDPTAVTSAHADEVTAWWAARQRFVVELDGELSPVPTTVEVRPPWELGPGFDLPAERLGRLLADHAVDARGDAGARFGPAELAVALGASPATEDGVDIIGPDGGPLVVDGGPLRTHLVPDVPGTPSVVALVSVDHGHLDPLRPVPPGAALAPDQLAAVGHEGGGARIIAPAGSGKTRVLTERARHLLGGWGVPTGALCLVAFNVRAAEEIRSRTTDLPALHVRTLNSLGLAIVNGGGPFPPRADGRRLETIDETEVRAVLGRLVRFPRRAGTDPAAPWLEALSAVRLGLRDPAEVEEEMGGDVDGLAAVVSAYRAELDRRGLLDYDEQIVGALSRLLGDPGARARARRACRVLLVDEFQDLAPAHLLLVRLLSAPTFDCFGVGDDDQTIYGYVGATPDWLVRFPHWFPGAGAHALEVNYRCSVGVVAAAANLLSRNRHRVPKQMRPAPGREPTDTDVVVERATDPADATCAAVRAHLAAGATPAEVAVLSRVNVTLLAPQLRLAAEGIPVTAPVDVALLSRSGVRAALAWLALASGGGRLPSGTVSDAARRPPRGLSPKLVEWMGEQRDLDGLGRLAGRLSVARDADKVEVFAADVAMLCSLVDAGAGTAEVLAAVRDRVGLGSAMETLDRSRGVVDRSAHGDDLAALLAVAHLHPDAAGFGAWLRRQLESSRAAARPDGVQLATVHRVKGREWPYVVVHDASAGLMPHRLATDTEEERRVFHVALTRSSVRTTVVSAVAGPSPFLKELDQPGAPPDVAVPTTRRTQQPAAPAATAAGTAPEGPLVEAFKVWRRERARADGVPAYVVLPDKALADIVARRPATLADLARCHGIGPTKLERYGDEILAVLASAGG